MEQLDLDRKALEPSIGPRARVSEVLSDRRRLTLDMIRRLHRQVSRPRCCWRPERVPRYADRLDEASPGGGVDANEATILGPRCASASPQARALPCWAWPGPCS